MASQIANNFRILLANKEVDFGADAFKIILMAEGFTFSRTTHDLYADVLASELATGFGYTQGTKALAGISITQDDVNNIASITWTNVSWTAAGGDIGPVCGAIIYDDTVVAGGADPIVGFIDFGGSYTEIDTGVATISNITIEI